MGHSFRCVLASDALTMLSVMVGQVTLPWWIAREGGARDLVLYATFAYGVSFVSLPVLSPLGDRVSKRVLFAVALAAMALEYLVLASLAQAGVYRIGWILALSVIEVMSMAVIMPVMASIAAELLPPTKLSEGLGLQKTAQALGRLLGPVVGGGTLAAAGVAAPLWLTVVLLLIACSQAARIVLPPFVATTRHTVSQWARDLRAGLAAKWKIPTERGWTFVSFLVVIFFMPGFGMLVPLKLQSLGLSAGWLGACEAALSVGLLVGSLGGSAWIVERVGRYRASVGAVLCQGLLLAWIGLAQRPALLVVAFMLAGTCVATMQLVGQTHRSLATPQHFRARMAAANMMALQLASTLGPGLAGLALAAMPVDQVYLLFAVGMFVMGLGYTQVTGYRRFLDLGHDEVAGLYGREHPALFGPPPAK